jgi:hypothetical protein
MFPAQRLVMDTAMEIDPESNTLAYRTVVVTVHRQFGKTLGLTLPRMVARAQVWARQSMVYCAQERNLAREKFEEDFVERIRGSRSFREGRDFTVRLSNGSERIRWSNGSIIRISATESKSGHGRTLDDASIDEAWGHRTTDVDQGFRVPMITRGELARATRGEATPGPQFWIVSTQGDEHSHYLMEKCELGRTAVEAGEDRGIAYFEWSCHPDWDIRDRSLWWFYLPALGHTISEADVAAEQLAMSESDWRRAYGNQPQDRSEEQPPPIDVEVWAGLVDVEAVMGGRIVYGVEVAEDRSVAWIGAAGDRTTGGLMIEVVESLPVRSVPDRLVELMRHDGAEGVALDPGSPAGALLDELLGLGLTVHKLGPAAHARATGALRDRIPSGEIFHLAQSDLDDAVEVARLRPSGESQCWDRSVPGSLPVVCTTLALGALLGLGEVEERSVYEDRGFVEW